MDLGVTLATVAAQLRALPGVATADVDPSKVTAPGVVVQLVSIEPGTLSQRRLNLQLLLVVADVEPAEVATNLGNLLATVETWGTADGPVTARSVQLPHTPAPLPGLAFPLAIYTP